MEKLLHERLREATKEDPIYDKVYIETNSKNCIGFHPQDAHSLADEIERHYTPLPIDENGQPVQWGETDLCWKSSEKFLEFNALSSNGVPMCYLGGNTLYVAEMSKDNLVKRPMKFLGADGVKIKLADKGWLLDTGEEAEVTDFCDSTTPIEVVTQDGVKWTKPSNFTHREPDSLEKLLQDMKETNGTFIFCKRLSAIIERDK